MGTPSGLAKQELKENLTKILRGESFPGLYYLGGLAIKASTAHGLNKILIKVLQVVSIPAQVAAWSEDNVSAAARVNQFLQWYDDARSKALIINTIFSRAASYGTQRWAFDHVMLEYVESLLGRAGYAERIVQNLRILTQSSAKEPQNVLIFCKVLIWFGRENPINIWRLNPSDEINKMVENTEMFIKEVENAHKVESEYRSWAPHYDCNVSLNIPTESTNPVEFRIRVAFDLPQSGLLHILLRHRQQWGFNVKYDYLSGYCCRIIDMIGGSSDPDDRHLYYELTTYFSTQLAAPDKLVIRRMQDDLYLILVNAIRYNQCLHKYPEGSKTIIVFQYSVTHTLHMVLGTAELNLITAYMLRCTN